MTDPRLPLLCAYYLFRRGMQGKMHPQVRRMREMRDEFYRNAWQRAAASLGGTLTPLSDGIVEIAKNGHSVRASGSMTSLDDPVTLQLAGDKPAVYRLLTEKGIPVPPHVVIQASELRNAAAAGHQLPPPLVVKPAADTGAGAGVSTNVRTARQMRRAVAWARAFGSRILIEPQVEGECYRVLLMDGEVIDTVVRRRPTVLGDGRSTVRQLIAAENRLRLTARTARAQVLIRHDPDLASTLARQGLSMRSRPPNGTTVELKQVINDNRAEENEAANGQLCPAILETARKAADAIGLRLAGVDVICRDPGVPLEQSGGVVIDVNATPGFYYHYHRIGGDFPVAEHLLRKCFTTDARP